MSDLNVDFKSAQERITGYTGVLSNDDMLKLYSLFKQGTFGDCDTERPGFMHLRAKAKWDVWNALKGKNPDEAQKEYIEYVDVIYKRSA